MSANQEGGSLWGMFVAVFFITLFVKISLWIIAAISEAVAGEDNFISKGCAWATKKIDSWKKSRKLKKAEKKEGKEVTEQK